MSGIAGVVHTDGRPVESSRLEAMVRATPHLGIDGVQTWREDAAGLIRFALSTTPEAVGETQPFSDPGGRTLVFDGRLDNRDELLDLLGAAAPARDAPDGAIVLAAHGRLGDGVLDRLVGDYALAVWDRDRRRLFCARSPVGWRPFLWTSQPGYFAFATEPATLVRGLGMERRLNEGAIAEHLSARFVTETDTFWEGVQRLPPGQALAVERGTVRTWRWHEGPFEDLSSLSEADHVERFNALFDQALVATTRSAGPVTAQLSGGLDSSTVVCRIHELVAKGRIDQMVGAVSARYPGELCDEGDWIEAVEAQCGLTSQSVFGAPFDPAAAARWSAQTLHLPLRPNTAGTLVAACDALNASGGRVLLTGEGGDDWLNGSRTHWPDLLLGGRWPTLAREAALVEAGKPWPTIGRSILAHGVGPILSPRRRAKALRPHLDFRPEPPEWISPDWARRIDLADRWRAAPLPPALDRFAQQQRYQVYSHARRHVNVDNVLSYAAGRGVEMRHPFHDLRLTRFLMGASGGMLRHGRWKKHLLREATRGTLPEVIRTRTSKANISAPIIDGVSAWIAERPISEFECVKRGWVDAAMLERFQATHEAWRRGGDEAVPLAPYAPVWNAVAIDLWLENAFGR